MSISLSLKFENSDSFQWRIQGGRPTPMERNFLNFMQLFGKIGKIVSWRPPGELAPLPTGNAGSALASVNYFVMLVYESFKIVCLDRKFQLKILMASIVKLFLENFINFC